MRATTGAAMGESGSRSCGEGTRPIQDHAQLLLPLPSRHLPIWGPEAPPNSVTGATVAPAALHLLEPVDAALLASQAAPGPVDELHPRLGVDSEVQEEADHLAVYQDARLCRACGQRAG